MNAASLNGAVKIEETALPPLNDIILKLFEIISKNNKLKCYKFIYYYQKEKK